MKTEKVSRFSDWNTFESLVLVVYMSRGWTVTMA